MTTSDERAERGRAQRAVAARSAHAELDLSAPRREPPMALAAHDRTRLPELLPIRYGRMAVSPFTFFRGAAAVMAADLARSPVSGTTVQLCGDAHLSNFGFFASPERRLVFDLNDFDETVRGPWEWDVERLAASIEIAARERAFRRPDRRAAVAEGVQSYREAMRRFARQRGLEVWYARRDRARSGRRHGRGRAVPAAGDRP